MEEDFVDTLNIEQISDGGFKRRVVTNHDKWGDIMSESQRRRGWEEVEEYNVDEEELDKSGRQ